MARNNCWETDILLRAYGPISMQTFRQMQMQTYGQRQKFGPTKVTKLLKTRQIERHGLCTHGHSNADAQTDLIRTYRQIDTTTSELQICISEKNCLGLNVKDLCFSYILDIPILFPLKIQWICYWTIPILISISEIRMDGLHW